MNKKNYYRIMLGRNHSFAEECISGNFIGADWFGDEDLTNKFPDKWKDFNAVYIPKYLDTNPEKSKVAAGLACGMLHTICKGISNDDIVMCPDGSGNYRIGKIIGDYHFVPNTNLPHRRKVTWFDVSIARSTLSEALQRSTGSIGTVSNISKHAVEIENLILGQSQSIIVSTDTSIEDPSAFAMEKHLEDFLIKNWAGTKLAENWDLLYEDGELVSQQFPSDTGPIDILAISKDRKEFLVVELKKGRASDSVVGQIQRYMGYILDEIAEENQGVKGCIIAFEDDLRIRRALKINPLIDFYRYEINFRLTKAQ